MVGPAVEVVADEDNAAVLVFHVLVGVGTPGLDPCPGGSQLEQVAARTVAGGHEYEVIVDDRSGNDGSTIGALRAVPQDLAVPGRHADDAVACHLHIEAGIADLGHHDGRIGGRVRDALAAPDHLAGFLVERRQCTPAAARRADEPIAIDQRRLGVTPV